MCQIECGVPHGSISGPPLFICYINDLANVTFYIQPFIYADDTTLFCQGSSTQEIAEKFQHDLNILDKCFIANKFSLDLDRTQTMLFCSEGSGMRNEKLLVKMKQQDVKQVAQIRYVGRTPQSQLTFEK